ncbi:ABC transporter permease [Vibrio quintilis]|uniref:Lipoprotein-releasing system transmembrane protein LolE n=1 Tax=Vibrio quintilis TaxID=1117707 RepID=A0A1M7YR39_9VIBR|nr:FtsX-like permease family protein [Vibrio quintilis]SHO55084.1 Lipoprotein-releasing system transmembrane protein LolE [Vibrio quintilis]
MLVRLAWRNLWRQKRRTMLTASALALALLLSLLTRALQEGSYALGIDHVARFYTGLIQLQNPGYADSLSIDDLLPASDAFIRPVREHPQISDRLPRLESFALAAVGEHSKGVMVIGAVPELEDGYSNLSQKLKQGTFLTAGDNQIMIGQGLADYFQLSVGDEMILYGQGYRGQTAAGVYRVKGILHFPMPQLDRQLVYMPLKLAQTLYSTGDQVSAWVLHTHDLAALPHIITDLQAGYGSQVNVRSWQDLSPELAQQILMDKVSGIFMIYVLYGIVGFALFATVLMMILERQREFAVMLATGMSRGRLVRLVSIESLLLAGLGIVIGMLVATPILIYLWFHPIEMTGESAQMMLESGFEPILPVSLDPQLVIDQVIAVMVLLAICLVYPLWRIFRLNIVGGLKGGSHAH